MNPKQEKIMTYIIFGVFAVALITDTVLDLLKISVPGFFSFCMCSCALLLLFVYIKYGERKKLHIILTAIAAVVSLASGLYQILG